jgi:hypothetical protein
MRRATLIALCALLVPWRAAACMAPEAAAATVTLRAVDSHGDVVGAVNGGESVRLHVPGLRLPPAARAHAMAMLGGVTASAEGAPDRWGRAGLRAPDLALALLRAGLAVTIPSDADPACVPAFLTAEDEARRAGRGLWRDPAARPLDARRGDAVQAQAGRHALMEGRIAHVGWTRRAAYLNFGRPGEGASAELGGAVWRALERQGWTRESLKGKHVRVRGVVSAGRRGRVLIDNVAAIEWLN